MNPMVDSFIPPVKGELLLRRRFKFALYLGLSIYVIVPLSVALLVHWIFGLFGVRDLQEFLGNFLYAFLVLLIFTIPFRLLDLNLRRYKERHPRKIYFSGTVLSRSMGKDFIRSETDKFKLNSGVISFGDATYTPTRKFRGNKEKLIDFLNER